MLMTPSRQSALHRCTPLWSYAAVTPSVHVKNVCAGQHERRTTVQLPRSQKSFQGAVRERTQSNTACQAPQSIMTGEWRGLSKQGWQEETISKNSGCCLRQAWGFGSPAWPGVEEFSLVPSAAHSFIAGNSPAPSHLCPRSFKPKLAKVIWINSSAAKWWLRCLRGLMQDHHCITAGAQTAFQAGEEGVSNKSCNWKRYT